MAILFDFKCDACDHQDEDWADHGDQVLVCPACEELAYKRTYKTFGIIQDTLGDASNSWASTVSQRRTYGEGRAYNDN